MQNSNDLNALINFTNLAEDSRIMQHVYTACNMHLTDGIKLLGRSVSTYLPASLMMRTARVIFAIRSMRRRRMFPNRL